MLRITLSKDNESPVLKIEGTLRDAWVNELRAVLDQHREQPPVQLDLRDVNFVDAAGVALLRELSDRGTHIKACSDFVAACLGWDTP